MTRAAPESSTHDPVASMDAERSKRSWGAIVPARLDAVVRHAGPRVLDVGCSIGAYVEELCSRGYDARGVDLLAHDQWRGPHADRFLRADAATLPFMDGSFDTVVSFEVLEHTVDPVRVLREYHRVARKNLVLSVPDCDQPPEFKAAGLTYHHWVDRTHRQMFTSGSLRRILAENGFRVEVLDHINPILPQLLCLTAWRIPFPLAARISRLIAAIPFRRRYTMTLLVVASRERGAEE